MDQHKEELLSKNIIDKEQRPFGYLENMDYCFFQLMLKVNLPSAQTALLIAQSVSLMLGSFMSVALRHIFKLQVASLRRNRTRVWITHC